MIETRSESTTNNNPWKKRAIAFGIWTVVGVSFGTRSYLQSLISGNPLTIRETVLSYTTDFYVWGILSPLIFWFCRRFPVARENWVGRIMVYLIISPFIVVTVTAVTIPATWYLGFANYTINPTLGAFFNKLIFNPILLHQGLLAYWGTVVAAHAYEYYRQAQISRTKTTELTAQLAQAQLAALKMQIHPHFLFNTLNSVSALIHKDPEAADRMIARLSDFLRLTLKSSDHSVVTLKEELEFLQIYLEIEKIRFQDRLVVSLDVDPAALDALVPNLILQPLVENAVRHGIGRTTSVGHLRIFAERSGERLVVKIEDNGPGFSASNGSGANPTAGNGIGLVNTKARLKKFYADFDLDIAENTTHRGAVVSISVPYLT
ncbi:MAG TPA: histidine kinase [Pyrinomonadaceae bacterium]|nr:histidine kinase [Pyrinomonadaceae bacterium]